jgi:hypothetical protein
MIDNLHNENFLIYAMKAYDKPNCIMSEFEEDLKRIKYIKRLIRRYRISGILKERLILNHIIILSNVFGVEASVKMLFFKLDNKDYPVLKTFLVFLGMLPEYIRGINNGHIKTTEIQFDLSVADKLRKI